MLKEELKEEVEVVKAIKAKTKFKFEMAHLDEIREHMKRLSEKCKYGYNTIDDEKSREQMYNHWKKRIEETAGTSYELGWYCDNVYGIPYDQIPENERRGWMSGSGKFSKWTPETALKQDGWEDGEVYWFSISKDSTYDYQLILKEGDWIEFDSGRREAFQNIGQQEAA